MVADGHKLANQILSDRPGNRRPYKFSTMRGTPAKNTMAILKTISKQMISNVAHLLAGNMAGAYLLSVFAGQLMNSTIRVRHGDIEMLFSAPNYLCRYRANTFSTKEPETLAWIDSFPEASVFWDVGSNVGLYSIYAAKKRRCRVFSFEPSVFNLEVFARNINLNALAPSVSLIPIAIGEKTGVGLLHMSSTAWGGALSTFDKTFGFDGEPLKQVFEYATYAVTLDDAVDKLDIQTPDFLKIDVDGIEHLILSGGEKLLRSVKSVLVEISIEFEEQAMLSKKYLAAAGLTLVENHGDQIACLTAKQSDVGTENQIWARK